MFDYVHVTGNTGITAQAELVSAESSVHDKRR